MRHICLNITTMLYLLVPSQGIAGQDNLEPTISHPKHQQLAVEKLHALEKQQGKKPNILVFLVDDMGWGDPGVYGGGEVIGAATPNIDRLANEGLRLTSAYSQPTCAPTRATILTGRLPIRHGLLRPPQIGEKAGLTGEITLAQLLKKAGYYTAITGKWHLGAAPDNQPQYNGFDEFYGILGSTKNYTEWRDARINPPLANDEEFVSGMLNSKTFIKSLVSARGKQPLEELYELDIPAIANVDIDFMKRTVGLINRLQDEEKPWFIYHAFGKVHYDNYPADGFKGRSTARGIYQDAVVEVDYIIGKVIAALKESGQADNTLVFFTSDNGPADSVWPDSGHTPFRGGKLSTWEGGVRVPAIAWWPGMIKAGRVSDGLFDLADLYNTAANLAGATLPTDRYIDGIDQTSFLIADNGESNRQAVYHYMLENFSAIRVGAYKQHRYILRPATNGIPGYINGSTIEKTAGLYVHNLYLDPKERRPYGIRSAIILKKMQGFQRRHLDTFKKYPAKVTLSLE